jgi:hypothetical protein
MELYILFFARYGFMHGRYTNHELYPLHLRPGKASRYVRRRLYTRAQHRAAHSIIPAAPVIKMLPVSVRTKAGSIFCSIPVKAQEIPRDAGKRVLEAGSLPYY